MRLSRVKIGFVAILGVVAVMAALPTAAMAIDSRITTTALYNQANSYPNGTTVGDGQCFDFGYQVFKAVAQSVGSSALIGNAGDGNQADGGYGYYGCYLHAGGVEVSQDEAQRGDYIQIYDSADPWNYEPTVPGGLSVHTAIIQDNLGGGVFNVIDENYTPLTVDRHQFTPAKHIASCGGFPWTVAYWRLGTVDSPPPAAPTEIGMLTSGHELYVKSGDLGATWVDEAGNVSAFQLEGTRIAALQGKTLWVKDGIGSTWVDEYTDATAFQLGGQRDRHAHQRPELYVKSGDLGATWVDEAGNVSAFQLEGTRIAALQGKTLWVKDGIGSTWVDEYTDATAFQIWRATRSACSPAARALREVG